MVNQMNQENRGIREEDQKPSFVLFAILNGVLALLVLSSITAGIILAVEINSADVAIVGFLFYGIGIIVDLSAVIIGFIAVFKKNAAGIVVYLSVAAWQLVAQAPIVLITDIFWIYWITTATIASTVARWETLKILMWTLVVLSLVRILIFVVIFFVGLNLYGKVQKIDNTNRGRIVGPARFMANRTNGPQTQESLAQRPQNQESLPQHQGNSAQNSAYPVQV